jgi:hypothetical protein
VTITGLIGRSSKAMAVDPVSGVSSRWSVVA